MFLALRQNEEDITDPDIKEDYLDYVQKVQSDI